MKRLSNRGLFDLPKRKKLEKLLKSNNSMGDIAKILEVNRTSVWHERMRMGSIDIEYNAIEAHEKAQESVMYHKGGESLPANIESDIRTCISMLKKFNRKRYSTEIDDIVYILEGISNRKPSINQQVTPLEEHKIMSMYREGVSYTQISLRMKRARSTIAKIIKQNKNQNTEEKKDEYLKSKWVNENQ